jgi:hypothetical protein
MKVGDMVKTHKGNLAIVVERYMIAGQLYVNIMFLKTGYLRTGFWGAQCEVISESR